MKKKDKIRTIFITMGLVFLFMVVGFSERIYNQAYKVYQVYLNGNKLGLIDDQDELYALINEEQKEIKETYQVDHVYPPNGFEIKEYKTYNQNVISAQEIYDKIKDEDDFTIEGYVIKIKFNKEGKEDLVLYVLNHQIFEDSLKSVINAFVEESDFSKYINNKQEEIEDVGRIIENMYFEETITVKPAHISVNQKIYTDPIELTQFLLFGSNKEQSSYTVKSGDTIASISSDNQLNTKEFLIANPKYKSEESILAIGEKVNITLINPILTLVESIYSVEDAEQVYEKEVVYDSSKPFDYSEVTQVGIPGIVRTSKRTQIVNGEENQGFDKISDVVIRETQNEITTKGGYKPNGGYQDNGKYWGWPTNRPYVITSDFAWRWGSFHDAIDISGTGMGSPIYASQAGEVVDQFHTCPNVGYYRNQCGGTYGNYVVIRHENGYYTMYAHLTNNVNVNIGDQVTRGQVIGYMGSSGSSTGTHLHFGVSKGEPNKGTWINPWSLFR